MGGKNILQYSLPETEMVNIKRIVKRFGNGGYIISIKYVNASFDDNKEWFNLLHDLTFRAKLFLSEIYCFT